MIDVIGVIYPVPANLVDRFFNGSADVFVKYVPHKSIRILPRHKIVFYASHASKKLVGEGVIESIEFLTPEEAYAKYENRVFLKEKEFHDYSGRFPNRPPTKEVLVLVLGKLKKYREPMEYGRPITMAGQYFTADQYELLIRKRE